MTKPVRFSRAEIANAALIAREHGVIVKMLRDGALVIFPEGDKSPTLDEQDETDLDAELRAFEAEHGDD